ncbi:MAG TPA: hypothetical protein VHC47_13570 [Mucilaginibacter sp.]|nr:hypothetical protein [Mucilaginibacter sp.]
MLKKTVLGFLLIILGVACKKKDKINPVVAPVTQTDDSVNVQHISMLTQHFDNTRAGLNSHETALTTANVNTAHFGKLFILPVDDDIYAQPLVVGSIPMGSSLRNVAFIATVNNSVYAFDADNGKLYWKKNYTESGMRPPNATDLTSPVWWCNPYTDFRYNIGIVGTPVIDSAALTMYFVARSCGGNGFVQYLHAVDILTGAEQTGSPVKIEASVPGTGDASTNGMVHFDPKLNNQRQGLALVNGIVYISFSSHCDLNPYHGWIIGYDEKTLQQRIIYNDTPDGENGGIWESGMGIAADNQGNLYVTTGNGTVGKGNLYYETSNGTGENAPNPDPADLRDRGESALKLTPSGGTLQISSYFTPTNYFDLNVNDLDYGVMGTFLIPNSNYYFTGCKDGSLYLLDKDNMGGYSGASNQNWQTIPGTETLRCQPAYFNGGTNELVYVWPENEPLHSYAFNRASGKLSPFKDFVATSGPLTFGADLSVSSNGTKTGTGILWASYSINSLGHGFYKYYHGILRAFDASDVSKELWNSDQIKADAVGNWAKFDSPTIANGKVYLATFSNQVVVYGLK